MKAKHVNRLWAICLLIIGIVTIILFGGRLLDVRLPDFLVRMLGVMDLIAMPIFIFASIKKFKEYQQ